MDQETQPQPQPQEQPTKSPLLDEAIKQADRIEKANAEFKELLARQEEILSKQILGGKSFAGIESKQPQMTPTEYAKALRDGKISLK